MDSLCPLDHLYVSWVKFYSFLYPLSIMTKRGRKCGFFLRFYMLGGVVFHLVRGSVYLLVVLEASFSFLYTGLVTIFTYIMLIFDIYIYIWCMFSSPTSPCIVSFLSLYTCFFMYAIFIFVSYMMPWWVLFECYRKTGCESLSCRELFSRKVFQEFVAGIDLFYNTTSGYEFSDLRLLSWLFVLLWFCYELPKGEIVKDIFYVIGKSFDKMHFTCYWVDLGWV